jgi:four helix bundle protein
MKGDDLARRLMEFSIAAIRIARPLATRFEGRHVAHQLLRSATASGANYEEARGAESRADFVHKIRLSGKEMRESYYWLQLTHYAGLLPGADLTTLIGEARELVAILASSANTANTKRKVVR